MLLLETYLKLEVGAIVLPGRSLKGHALTGLRKRERWTPEEQSLLAMVVRFLMAAIQGKQANPALQGISGKVEVGTP